MGPTIRFMLALTISRVPASLSHAIDFFSHTPIFRTCLASSFSVRANQRRQAQNRQTISQFDRLPCLKRTKVNAHFGD